MCPHEDCRSENVRITERGAVHDTYICNTCRRTYKRLSPRAKWRIGAAVVGAVVTGGFGGLLVGLIPGPEDLV